MKKAINNIITISALTALFLSSLTFAQEHKKYKQSDFRNYFGLAWTSSNKEILQYCKNVGHTHVMYKYGMENDSLSDGMTFYIETPEYGTYERTIDLSKTYPKEKIEEWENICAVAFSEKSFPENMATGWYFNKTIVSLQLDMQQKKVHERTIKRILEKVESITNRNPKFKFGGFTWDVPQPYGDFNALQDNASFNKQVTLKYWTGTDSTPERKGITHDFNTYFEGYFEFYRKLMEESRKINPKAKFIIEPYNLYNDWVKYYESDFFKSKGDDAKKYMPDFLWSEGDGVKFLSDENIYKSGFVKKSKVGSSSPNTFTEEQMRKVAGNAAEQGAWACFFGRYGGYDVVPWANSIRDIPTRIKLGKLIPVWENLNNTPLKSRKFDGEVYTSPTAYMSTNVYWALQPKQNKIIFTFNTINEPINLPSDFKIDSIVHLDGIFTPCGKVRPNLIKIEGNTITPLSPDILNMPFLLFLKARRLP